MSPSRHPEAVGAPYSPGVTTQPTTPSGDDERGGLLFLTIAGAGLAAVAVVVAVGLLLAAAAERAYADAQICAVARAQVTTSCIEQMQGTIADESRQWRSPTYDVQVKLNDGSTVEASSVSSSFHQGSHTGDRVVVQLWDGSVTWIGDGAVASFTGDAPANRYEGGMVGTWLATTLALFVVGWVTLLRRRRAHVRPPVLGPDPITFRMLPTAASIGFFAFHFVVPAGLIAAMVPDVTIGRVLEASVGGVVLAAALVPWLRRSSVVVDQAGIRVLQGSRVSHEAPWGSVLGLRWFASGNSRVRDLALADGSHFPVLGPRFLTAAAEPLVALVSRPPGGSSDAADQAPPSPASGTRAAPRAPRGGPPGTPRRSAPSASRRGSRGGPAPPSR